MTAANVRTVAACVRHCVVEVVACHWTNDRLPWVVGRGEADAMAAEVQAIRRRSTNAAILVTVMLVSTVTAEVALLNEIDLPLALRGVETERGIVIHVPPVKHSSVFSSYEECVVTAHSVHPRFL